MYFKVAKSKLENSTAGVPHLHRGQDRAEDPGRVWPPPPDGRGGQPPRVLQTVVHRRDHQRLLKKLIQMLNKINNYLYIYNLYTQNVF